MNSLCLRGNSIGMLVLNGILSTILVIFSASWFYLLKFEPMPVEVQIIVSIIVLCFLLVPCLSVLLDEVLAFYSKIHINGDRIVWSRPFCKPTVFMIHQISVWGGVSYAAKSTMLFFCTEEKQVILDYLHTKQEKCRRIFGEKIFDQLQNTPEGRLQLAVGTYLFGCMFHRNKKVFILRYGTPNRMQALVKALKKDALLTGPWLIQTGSSWELYAKYTHEDTGTIR